MGNSILENKRELPLYETLSFEERRALMRQELNKDATFPSNYTKAQYADLFTQDEALYLANTLKVNTRMYLSALSFLNPEARIEVMEKRGIYYDPSDYPCINLDTDDQKRRFIEVVFNSKTDQKLKFDNIDYLYSVLEELDLKLSYDEWKPLLDRAASSKNTILNKFFKHEYVSYLEKLDTTEDYLQGIEWVSRHLVTEGVDEEELLSNLLNNASAKGMKDDHIFAIYQYLKNIDPDYIALDAVRLMKNPTITKKIYDDLVANYGTDDFSLESLEEIFGRLENNKDKEDVLDIIIKRHQQESGGLEEGFVDGYALADYITTFPYKDQLHYLKKYIKYLDKSTSSSFAASLFDAELDTYYQMLAYCHQEGIINNDEFENPFFTFLQDDDIKSDAKVPEYIINYFCKKYDYPEANIRKFIDKYEYKGIGAMIYRNIQNTLALDEEKFDKYMSLMDNHKQGIRRGSVNDIASVILMQKFRTERVNTYNKFVNFEQAIRTKNENNVWTLWQSMNDANKAEIIKQNGYATDRQFITDLLGGSGKALNILHEITNKHIAKQRETYFQDYSNDFIEKLSLDYDLDKNSYIDAILKAYKAPIVYRTLENSFRSLDGNPNFKGIPPLFKDKARFMDLFEIRKGKGYPYYNEGIKRVSKEEWRQFEELLCMEDVPFSISTSDIKKHYKFPYVDNSLELMKEINPTNIDFDSPAYKYLKEKVLDQYDMLSWGDIFKGSFLSADIDAEDYVLSSMIGHFDLIYKQLYKGDDKKISLKDILDTATVLSYDSNKYMKLLGKLAFDYIQRNPGPNASTANKHNRLENAVQLVRDMYRKQEVSVPPINLDIEEENGKVLNISIGSSTSAQNLYSGELTGACTRIKGAFAGLFDKALIDKDAFFVMIRDNDTGALVSRVIGIRKGNSVFLNELRYSIMPHTFSHEDVANATKDMAQVMVDVTANDEHPIENVFGITEMSFEGVQDRLSTCQASKIIDVLEQEETNYYYENIFVIATSTQSNRKYAPLKTDDKYSQLYPCATADLSYYEEKSEVSTQEEIQSEITRRVFTNEVVESKKDYIEIDDIDIDNNPLVKELKEVGVSKAWISDTYYYYIDKAGNHHKFIMDAYKNNNIIKDEIKYVEKVVAKLKKGENHEEKGNSKRSK